ncbi:hypothetical protein B0H34DRAFT_704058 [Crassisporium funariophilum]|nr:hypothetical protein B0H34DRAFT_704058 [Crassisporium funariophilum]
MQLDVQEYHELCASITKTISIGSPHVLAYNATPCKYQSDSSQAGSSRSTCGATALMCVCLAFQTEVEEAEEMVMPTILSEANVDDIIGITNHLSLHSHMEVDDLLKVPIFQQVCSSTDAMRSRPTVENFKFLLLQWFPSHSLKPIIAAVISQTPETVVCLRLRFSGRFIYVVFDSHPRLTHPFGPAFVVTVDFNTTANYLSELLTPASLSKGSTLWHSERLYPFSAHLIELNSEVRAHLDSILLLPPESISSASPTPYWDLSAKRRARAELAQSKRTHKPAPDASEASAPSSPLRPLFLASKYPIPTTTKTHHYTQSGSQPSLMNVSVSAADMTMDDNCRDNSHASPETSTSLIVDKELSLAETSDTHRRSDFAWLSALLPQTELSVNTNGGNQANSTSQENSQSSDLSEANKENLPNSKLSHMRSRGEFGWQLALQQKTAPEVNQSENIHTEVSVSLQLPPIPTFRGKSAPDKRTVAFFADDPDSECLSSKENGTAWEFALQKQLQEEEELAAFSSTRGSKDNTWLLAFQKRIQQQEELSNAVASSSFLNHADLDWQLAVQLQQEEDERNPAAAVASTSKIFPDIVVHDEDNITVDSQSSQRPAQKSNRRHGRLTPDDPQRGDFLESIHRWRSSTDFDGFATLELPAQASVSESFECGVCSEMHGVAEVVRLPNCHHAFCKDCLRSHTVTKVGEGRYPIFCPVCAIERSRMNKSQLTQEVFDKLVIPEPNLERLAELQLMAFSVSLHCPRCKTTMNVDREDYGAQNVITCPLQTCSHKWCKSCNKTLASSEAAHNCKNNGLDRLMRRKGWKYCPGCITPVQKETGCNHMTCGSPGCNVYVSVIICVITRH